MKAGSTAQVVGRYEPHAWPQGHLRITSRELVLIAVEVTVNISFVVHRCRSLSWWRKGWGGSGGSESTAGGNQRKGGSGPGAGAITQTASRSAWAGRQSAE